MIDLDAIRHREQTATKGPWRVEYRETRHRKGSLHCRETCGVGHVPLRVETIPSTDPSEETEVHVLRREFVIDILSDATKHHLFCAGHDYEERGLMKPIDAEFIAHARADVPALLAEVTRLRKELELTPTRGLATRWNIWLMNWPR